MRLPASKADGELLHDDEATELFWDCVTDRGDLTDEIVAARDRLADAARHAQLVNLFALLDDRTDRAGRGPPAGATHRRLTDHSDE